MTEKVRDDKYCMQPMLLASRGRTHVSRYYIAYLVSNEENCHEKRKRGSKGERCRYLPTYLLDRLRLPEMAPAKQ